MSTAAKFSKPELSEIESICEFEKVAQAVTPAFAWQYIAGGESDTMACNRNAFDLLKIRQRVLQNVLSVNLKCSVLGQRSSSPLYLSSIAKGGLVAKDERTFVGAAYQAGVPYIVPTVGTAENKDIFGSAAPDQRLAYQFYLLGNNKGSMIKLQEAVRLGCSAVVITVDNNAPRQGALLSSTQETSNVFPDPRFTWDILEEVMETLPCGMPVYLKGVQTAEDALRAAGIGVQGIIVSNHGGRACGGSRSALESLQEITSCLRAKNQIGVMEILFDSGVRCGRDVFKALCLGATGVGIGRPYYWASAAYGAEGIVAALDMLMSELRHTMRQAGAPVLNTLSPSLLCRAETPWRPLRLSWDDKDSAMAPGLAKL